MKFYTNVIQHKGKILVRGIENGIPFKERVKYEPYLFINSGHGESKYTNIHGESVYKIDFDSISEAKNYIKNYEEVDGHIIYGMNQFVYPFIFDNFKELDYDPTLISVVSIDIETLVGEESITEAVKETPNEITAITLTRNGNVVSLGCGDYVPHKKNVRYIKCKNEIDLLYKFVEVWNSPEFSPDVITGYNITFFDIPYIVGRMTRLIGESKTRELSPWGIITSREIDIRGQRINTFEFEGIATLDYYDLYQKFTYSARESYKLDYIANFELGIGKLDYSDYKGLNDLYENNYQLYMEYNIHDAELILLLEEKMGLIALVFAIAYDARANYRDALTTVRLWDVIIHDYLLRQNIVINPAKVSKSGNQIIGGYVKDPQTGMHHWVVSFDLNSLYPHLIQQYNISPETFVKKIAVPDVDDIINGEEIEEEEYSVTANGCCFRKDKQGFLPALSEKGYADRSAYKKKMIEAKQKFEETKDKKYELEISRFDKLQHAKKIILNGLYGALANIYFRWYDIRFAEAITLSGQLSTKWVSKDINKFLNKILKSDDKDYIIAIDTDSCYINLNDLVKQIYKDNPESDLHKITKMLDRVCSTKLQDVIDESYDRLAIKMNAFGQRMFMKRECIADKAIWVAKKRYVLNVYDLEGVTYSEPVLKLSGIEAVRSSTPASCRDSIKESLVIIMNKDEDHLQQYVKKFNEEFKKMSFEQIAFPRGITNIQDYTVSSGEIPKGTPIHARGSLLYNKIVEENNLHQYEKIGNGDKIRFCYLKTPNPYGSNVIAALDELPKEFGLEQYIDYDMQFEKAFVQPLSTIVDSIGWSTEKKISIEDFF